MSESLRKLFNASKLRRQESDTVKVLVSLEVTPDHSCLAGLEEIGLTVKSVTGNKLTGEISSKLLAALEQHASVAQVERSVTLKPTDDRA